jgi:sterol desaturase/sphingolipid hydroxylase (fatty acid hydroxylase superfamily)
MPAAAPPSAIVPLRRCSPRRALPRLRGRLRIVAMAAGAILFAAGVFAWTLVEYVIHGVLSHRLRTFASPLHDVHHRDPRAVFTAGAWVPVALATVAGLGFFGLAPAMLFCLGVVAGFIGYEAIHYRIHFARPRSRWEAELRTRHLAHHLRTPGEIFGVTTALWDRAFGTQPAPPRMHELERAAADIAPLSGPSNWRRAFTMPVHRR